MITDSDVFDGDMQVKMTVKNGILSVNITDGLDFKTQNGQNTIQFNGSVIAINNAVNSIAYISKEYFYGNEPLKIEVSDIGNSGISNVLYLKISKIIPIKVKARPPVVILHPIHQIKSCVGYKHSLRVEADGAPPITYQWYKNGSILFSERDSIINLKIKNYK